MKTKAICLLALALLSGAAMANEKETTYDSLNVRVVWTFHGTREFGGLAMAPDTTLWTCYPGTNTLIKIDASDPDAIDTNFYEMDSLLGGIIGITLDSMLLIQDCLGGDCYIRTININTSPPALVGNYTSEYVKLWDSPMAMRDSLLVTYDFQIPPMLTFVNISDPTDIDTFATNIDPTIYGYPLPYHYAFPNDTLLYGIRCRDLSSTEPPYSLSTHISLFNISDYYNPIYDTTHSYGYGSYEERSCPSPAVVVDTLMFVAANYYEGPLADVYSIADPTSPVYLGEIGVHSWMYSKYVIDYQNGYLYSGMWIHDVVGYPTTDSLVGYIDGQPTSLKICGKYIYQICGDTFGITEFYEYDPNHVFVPEIKAPPRPSAIEISAYPNPFNSAVTIAVDCRGLINQTPTVEIFDVNGRKIDVIARRAEPNEAISPNNRSSVPLDTRRDAVSINNCEFVWQPHESLPSGVYLVRARIGDCETSRRIVYLK